jgi:hypothetical protein
MSSLSHKNVAPIEVHSDGRRYKRFAREEAVRITFRGQDATGNLANLSATGLLATFSSSDTLPAVSEKVAVHIDIDGRDNVLDVQGVVVRIQIPAEYEVKDGIEIAVNFSDLLPAAKHSLQKLINFLLVRDKNYKT